MCIMYNANDFDVFSTNLQTSIINVLGVNINMSKICFWLSDLYSFYTPEIAIVFSVQMRLGEQFGTICKCSITLYLGIKSIVSL